MQTCRRGDARRVGPVSAGARAAAFACAVVLGGPWAWARAWAQEPGPPGSPPAQDRPVPPVGQAGDAAPAPEVTPEELEELQRALGADQPDAPADEPLGQLGAAIQSMNPDIAVVLDFAGAWYSSDDARGFGGHDPSKTGFNLQQLELSIGATVDPVFRFDANLVFAQFGVELEEAYATTLGLPVGLQVRFGQMLFRFGRINASHPHAWSFVDQPLVVGKMLGSEGSRGLGGELSWLTPLPWYVELVASVGEATGECCARSFYGGADPGFDGAEDLLTTLALKQFFPFDDDWSLSWGLSTQLGPNATGNGNRTELYASDLYLRYYPVASQSRTSVSLTVEGVFRTRQVPDDVLQDWGGYAQLVWRIDPDWEVGGRGEYLSGVAGDPLDPGQDGERARYAVAATYYPSHFSRLRLQGAADVPEWAPDPVWSVVLAAEVVVGAHGAHSF